MPALSRLVQCECGQIVPAPVLVWRPRFGDRVNVRQWRSVSSKSHTTDLYKLLGVSASATPPELKGGFLKQVRVHHPDINADPNAVAAFHEIQRALEVLIDPTARREYDASTIGLQPDWVYADGIVGSSPAGESAVPLAAMTETELLKRAEYVDERIRACSADIASLQKVGASVTRGGVQFSRLTAKLADYSGQRRELRNALSQIAAARIRHGGGNRRRKKLSERAQQPETAWYAPPPGVPQDIIDMTRKIIAEMRRNPAAPDLEASFQPMRPSAKHQHREVDCATGFTSETREV